MSTKDGHKAEEGGLVRFPPIWDECRTCPFKYHWDTCEPCFTRKAEKELYEE